MSNIETAHIDWVNEVVEANSDMSALKMIADIEEIVALCEAIGTEKIIGICNTIRNPKSKRSTVTSAQRFAIADFLIGKYENAGAVIAEAWK